MRMISSTSTTSTSGVTLMPVTGPDFLPPASVPATSRLRVGLVALGQGKPRVKTVVMALHLRQEERADRLHVVLEVLGLLLEHVVGDDRGERDQDADRG